MATPASKPTRQALIAALIFAVVALPLQAWRSHVLLASYDQGIFHQVLWNSLREHPFESTLSSQLSTNVIHSGEPAGVGYARLGQHFTPTLLIWAPLLGLIGGAALPLAQVGLITFAGLVLHRLALQLVPTNKQRAQNRLISEKQWRALITVITHHTLSITYFNHTKTLIA
jgi:uncharacterized membrane protein